MEHNIRSIRPFLSMLVFLSISFSLNAQSVKTLFKVIPNAEQVLTPTERSKYTAISEEEAKEKALIEITELVNVLAESTFSVPLKGANHLMRSERFTQEKEGGFTYSGSFSEATGELYIYATNGYVYGNIHIDSLAYQIEPVNKKYALLLRRDYSGKICQLEIEHKEEGKFKGSKPIDEMIPSTSTSNPVIDVMVVFSNQAAAATLNMEALALGSIQSSNNSFSNSDAGVTFNLVHYQQVNYDDSGNSSTDVNRLEGTSDGYIDNIHSLKDQHGADVVMLMVNSTDACGRASEIGPIALTHLP